MKVKNLLFALAAMLFAATAAAQKFHSVQSPDGDITTAEGVRYYLYDDDNTAMLVGCRDFAEESYEIPQYVTGKDGTKYEVTEIYREAFLKINSLESVTIPKSVKVVGYSAFGKCKKLKTVNSPNTFMGYVGTGVFDGTPWLTDYKAKYKNQLVYWCGWVIEESGVIDDEDLEIHEGYVGIVTKMWECKSYGVVIPKSLEWIEPGAFSQMPNLTYFSVSKVNPYYYWKAKALYRKSNIISKNSGYDRAGDGNYLSVYPRKQGMTKQYITEPGVVGIDRAAFYGVKYLKEVIVSEGVKYIGSEAFHEVEMLEYLQLPSTIEEMEGAVGDCSNLKTIVIPAAKKPELRRTGQTFSGCSPDLIIYVPANLLEEYKADKAYTNYAKEIRAIDSQVVGIEQAKTGGDAEVKAIYSTDGTRLNAMQKGVNIVKMGDGTVRKVVRK